MMCASPAQDLDRIKKAPGYTSLRELFIARYGAPESDGFKKAQEEFSKSLAAYSILMWLLLLRDRHNGERIPTTRARADPPSRPLLSALTRSRVPLQGT